jgi:putative membrane protein
MLRTIILMLFTYFFFHLHATGNISKYINMKYAFLSLSALVILIILTIVQFVTWLKEDNNHESCSCGGCHHDHHSQSKLKRTIGYGILLFPIVSGLFLPIATLDSNIVRAKGFYFPSIQNKDNYVRSQYLRPDTSIYYGKDGYEEIMKQGLQQFSSSKKILLTDRNYLKGMETIYNFPGEFMGKTIEFEGFAFKGENIHQRQWFVLRFGIIHCIADSGVYGMLVEFPEDLNIKNDEWVRVRGTLSSIYYQPFKSTIPLLKVTSWSKIPAPEDPYVYRVE